MTVKLDLKDKKILYELDRNSRQSFTQLGKKVGLDKGTVRYRVENLKSSGVIYKFLTVINRANLGEFHYKICIKFQSLTEKIKEEIIDYLKNNPYVISLFSCDGEFDLYFVVTCKSIFILDDMLAEFNNKYGKYMNERQISNMLVAHFFPRGYLLEKERIAKETSTIEKIPKVINIDDKDWKILALLSQNSRFPIIEIAKEIKLKPNSVIERIKKLEKSKIIQDYMVYLDVSKFNYLHYKILFNLHFISKEKEKEFLTYCKYQQNIYHIIRCLGNWDLEIDVEVKDQEEFRKVIMDLTNSFSDTIKSYSVLNVYKTHKFDFLPTRYIEKGY